MVTNKLASVALLGFVGVLLPVQALAYHCITYCLEDYLQQQPEIQVVQTAPLNTNSVTRTTVNAIPRTTTTTAPRTSMRTNTNRYNQNYYGYNNSWSGYYAAYDRYLDSYNRYINAYNRYYGYGCRGGYC